METLLTIEDINSAVFNPNSQEACNYEAYNGNGQLIYLGDNWLDILVFYHHFVQHNQDIIVWEGDEIVREYHNELGHCEEN
jgi:hypothetical protein